MPEMIEARQHARRLASEPDQQHARRLACEPEQQHALQQQHTLERDVEAAAIAESSCASGVEADDELIAEELLIEDVSIDGMCGVY